MSPCCSARRPSSGSAAMRSTSSRSCGGCRSRRNGSTRSCGARSSTSRMRSRRRCLAEPEQVKNELIGQISAVLGPGLRRRHAFHAALPAVAAAHRLRAGCGLLPQRQGRQGLRRHRRDRALRRERHPAEIGQDAARRHRRHRDRLQSLCARRHRFRRRRQAARFRRDRHLSRHDVHGHSEHGLGVRLFPRQLDACAPIWWRSSFAGF